MRNFLIILFYLISQPFAFGMENVFYILHDNKKEALASIETHTELTHVLIAQAYYIDQIGFVSGKVDDDVFVFANRHSIKLFAMVTNKLFDADSVHHFLSDPIAQQKALNTLLDECKKNNFAGIQFDFEMIPLKDKTALTQFYQNAADLLHKQGLMVSFAIAPTLTDDHFTGLYQKKLYDVWQGAYDFKKLGEISDFVTLMSYDQHGEGTTPGPIASAPWDEHVIQHALKWIPANKISLGIPTYSGLWYMDINPTSKKTSIQYDFVDYKTLTYILNKFKPNVQWDNLNKVNYTFYEFGSINKYLFIEDALSFKAKHSLAKQYQLRGISVFRLGIEDPAIWEKLKDKVKPWWMFW